MNGEINDAADIVRERIQRQTPRPRLSLPQLPKIKHVVRTESMEQHETDGVIVKNRFQHSQNKVLYSSNIQKVQQHSRQPTTTSHENNTDIPTSNDDHNPVVPRETHASNLQRNLISSNLEFCIKCGAAALSYDQNVKRCLNCGAFTLINSHALPQIAAAEFYKKNVNTCNVMAMKPVVEDVDTSKKKRSQSPAHTNQRKRAKKKPKDKVCLTISSDEDEKSTESVDRKEMEEYDKSHEVQDSQVAQPNVSEEIVPTTSTATSYKIPKISDRMKQKGGKKDEQQPSVNVSQDVITTAQYVPVKNPLTYANNAVRFELPVSHVQFGSLQGKGLTPLTLQNSVLRIEIECSFEMVEGGKKKRMNEKYKLALSSVEVAKITLNCEREPFLLCVIPSKRYSEVVNKALNMNVIDAQSEVSAKQQIIFVIQNDSVVFKKCMEQNLPELQKIAPIGVFGRNDIMNIVHKMIAPEEFKKDYNIRSKAGSPQESKPIVTLFVYPPPPIKGGIAITNADVDCLRPGIYLNDTIIDFYLKFLYEEKLTTEQKKKTYIFNSYFYTRLIKKGFSEADKSLPPAERMHAQVKKWTREVDLFGKDFILIPINEHSHWFLAIICFPSRVEKDDSTEEDLLNESTNSDIEEVKVEEPTKGKDESKMEIDEVQSQSIANSEMGDKTRTDVPGITEDAQDDDLDIAEKNEAQDVSEEPKNEHTELADSVFVANNIPATEDQEDTVESSTEIAVISSGSEAPQEVGIGSTNLGVGDTTNVSSGAGDILDTVESAELKNTSENTAISQPKEPETRTQSPAFQEAGVVEFQQPCILIFDSLVSGGRSRVFTNLRQYLTVEWKEKKGGREPEKKFTKNNIKGSFPKIPLQSNDCDCGIYVLQFAESFFDSPIVNYKFPIKKESWFTKEHADGKRTVIKELIDSVHKRFSKEKAQSSSSS